VTIPLSRPPVDDEIRRAVLEAVDSRQYILGPQCRALETELAGHAGVGHAVLTSSATAALWMTFKALGVGPGDEVLVPSHTAFPTVEAVCFAGGTPVFVDVDDCYTLDPKDAAGKVTPRTVGIVPVHLYGQPAELPAVQDLASRHGLWLLEDCAQAQGAAWDGRPVGGFGRAGVLSFYPSKNLPAMGDGGAVLTSDDALAARCRRLRDHGRPSRDVHAEIGFNLRFNELQASALRVLLRRLDAMNDRRRALAARYARGLAGLPLVLPRLSPLRRRHAAARRAGGLPRDARHRDRHPLSRAESPTARDRRAGADRAPAHGAARRGDPDPADVGAARGRRDRRGGGRRPGVLRPVGRCLR
jgi:dTDP-4-amino-4,6-dideoxygalactose transaminase